MKNESTVGFGGRVDAVILREGKPIKRRDNLGMSWFKRLLWKGVVR